MAVQKAEGTFFSAWHGAGSLPLFAGGEVSRINDAWPGWPMPGGGTAGGSMMLYIAEPTFLGEAKGLKTYEAEGSTWTLYDSGNAIIWSAPSCKVTYRTQPNPNPEPTHPILEHIIQIDVSGVDSTGATFGAMTPRVQGPSAGFGKVDVRLVVNDGTLTDPEMRRELRVAL